MLKYLGLSLLVIIILILSGCLNKSLNYGDFEISDISWGNQVHSSDGNSITNRFNINVVSPSTDKELFFHVFDKSTDKELDYTSTYHVNDGVKSFEIRIQNYKDSTEIEVCISYNEVFDNKAKGVVCKSKILPPMRINLEVSPDPLKMTVSMYNNPSIANITVTNTGEITLRDVGVHYFEEETKGLARYGGVNGREDYKPCIDIEPGKSCVFGFIGHYVSPHTTIVGKFAVGALYRYSSSNNIYILRNNDVLYLKPFSVELTSMD